MKAKIAIENLWRDLRSETDEGFRRDIKEQIKAEKNNKEGFELEILNLQDEDILELTDEVLKIEYMENVRYLERALLNDSIKIHAIDLIQNLIERIEVIPDPSDPDSIKIIIRGDFNRLVSFCLTSTNEKNSDKRKLPSSFSELGSQLSVVAGARNLLKLRFIGSTFRAPKNGGISNSPVILYQHFLSN
mgnify:CR=1 FL=1